MRNKIIERIDNLDIKESMKDELIEIVKYEIDQKYYKEIYQCKTDLIDKISEVFNR